MTTFDECCVLIPASTLEDFPAKLSDNDARSLLAGWTVLWHPRLLVQTEQVPAWYRADSPPEPVGRRIIVAPQPSLSQIPSAYQSRVAADPNCRWITGGDRSEMIRALELSDCPPLVEDSDDPPRSIAVDDFFAAGYASLQIQIMTRRLRYTSNLDEIHLQTRIVEAARAFIDGRATEATEALHDVFDALAEERDHYFTSDPHLVDLTLVTKSTLTPLVQDWSRDPGSFSACQSSDSPVLPTPRNVLMDASAVAQLGLAPDPDTAMFCQHLRDGKIGWAGGGPSADQHLDAMTLVQAQDSFAQAHREAAAAIGVAPPVYGRLAGSTPSDMTATIAALGYKGLIPIDFAGGTGHGDEAKVIMQAGGIEIEALTAKPIDASADSSFLAIGAQLGEAIDSGEIATALLVHWPGQGCDSFDDLRRIGSWSVSMGRFWRIDRYFSDGEHPYHHGVASAASSDSAALLDERVAANTADPISSIATAFRDGIRSERDAILNGMTALISGQATTDQTTSIDVEQASAPESLAVATGSTIDARGDAVVVINPHAIGVREHVLLAGPVKPADHVFASSPTRNAALGKSATAVTIDVPAFGFATLRPRSGSGGAMSGNSGIRTWLRNKWLGNSTSIAENGRLQNEFLEATIQSESGGISGVFSGAARGNRFSMRLVAEDPRFGKRGPDEGPASRMVCHKTRVLESSMAVGVIETTGRLSGPQDEPLATFTLRYTLRRGSRVIDVDGEVTPQATLGDDPWRSYIAARAAVSSDASIGRVLLRDKVHRGSGRRLVSPLGLVIDEADRQTMIASDGLPFHRRVHDRFFDTLLSVQGETAHSFKLHYGFDVPNPIDSAKAIISPPVQVSVRAGDAASDIGWIVHCAPVDVSVSSLGVCTRDDGSLAATIRVIQTRPRACKATLRFFRDVKAACLVGRNIDVEDERLKSSGDQVTVPLVSHAVADVLVIF